MFCRVGGVSVPAMMRSIAASIAVMAVLAVPALASSGQVWVVSTPSCITTNAVARAQTQYKPKRVQFGCSQHEGTYYAKLYVRGLHWSKWTGSAAIGTGTMEVGSCSPSCKRGKVTGYAVQMTLGGARRCPKAAHKLFTTATFTFSRKQRPSPTGEGTYALPCGGDYAAADIARGT